MHIYIIIYNNSQAACDEGLNIMLKSNMDWLCHGGELL